MDYFWYMVSSDAVDVLSVGEHNWRLAAYDVEMSILLKFLTSLQAYLIL